MSTKYTTYIYDAEKSTWITPLESGNYDQLDNQPVQNARGTADNNVVLSGLDFGHYTVSGYYKEDSTSESKVTSMPLDVMVMPDADSGDKVVSFPIVNHGIYEIHILTYHDGSLVNHDIQVPGSMFWKQIT